LELSLLIKRDEPLFASWPSAWYQSARSSLNELFQILKESKLLYQPGELPLLTYCRSKLHVPVPWPLDSVGWKQVPSLDNARA